MSTTWKTKFGSRRVKQEPPTLEEAIFAARGMTDDVQQQVEIAAQLMDMPLDKVRVAALKASQQKDVNRSITFTKRGGADRAVIVERKVSRRPITGYRPLSR